MAKITKNIIPFFFTTTIIITLLSLGLWQLHRLYQKRLLIGNIIQKQNQPVVDLADVIDSKNDNVTSNLLFSKIKVRGKFLPDKNIFLYGRHKNKYVLVSPLLTETKDIIMIVRGIIGDKNLNQLASNLHNNNKESIVELTGIGLEFEQPKRFIPDNNIKSKIWFSLQKSDIEKYIDAKTIGFYLLQTNSSLDNTNDYIDSLPSNMLNKIANNHLEYAITWFSLALSVIVIYFLRFHRKQIIQ